MAATWKLRSFQRRSWFFIARVPNRRTARWVSVAHKKTHRLLICWADVWPITSWCERSSRMWATTQPSSACRTALWLKGTWRSRLNQVLWVFHHRMCRKAAAPPVSQVPTRLFLGSAQRLWRCSLLLLVQRLLYWEQHVGFSSLKYFFFWIEKNSYLKLCCLSTGCFYLEKSWTILTSRRPGTSTKRTLVWRCSFRSLKFQDGTSC